MKNRNTADTLELSVTSEIAAAVFPSGFCD